MNRKFDKLGRIVIPKEMREKLGLEEGSEANIELIDNKIIITNPKEVDHKSILKEIREIVNQPWGLGSYEDGEKEYQYKKKIIEIIDKGLNK